MNSTRDRALAPDAVKADLDTLLATFADIHPNPFWSRTRTQFEADISRITAKVQRQGGIAEGDFFKEVARLVIAFDDPHCWAFVPGWKEFRDGGGRFFPVDLRFTGDGAARVAAGDSRLLGAEVLRVDDIPVKKLYAAFRPLTGQSDESLWRRVPGEVLPALPLVFPGPGGSGVALRIRDGEGERTVLLDGIDQKAYERRDAESEGDLPLAYRALQPGVGLLIFRSCVAPDRVRALAEPIFQTIRDTNVTRLVVDNRANPGGGDDGWHALLGFLTEKLSAPTTPRATASRNGSKTSWAKKRSPTATPPAAWTAPAGKEFVIPSTDEDLIRPAATPLKFKGSWCLLAGRGSFSAGMSFVCAVKAYKLALSSGRRPEGGSRASDSGWKRRCRKRASPSPFPPSSSTARWMFRCVAASRPTFGVRSVQSVAANSPADPVLQAGLREMARRLKT